MWHCCFFPAYCYVSFIDILSSTGARRSTGTKPRWDADTKGTTMELLIITPIVMGLTNSDFAVPQIRNRHPYKLSKRSRGSSPQGTSAHAPMPSMFSIILFVLCIVGNSPHPYIPTVSNSNQHSLVSLPSQFPGWHRGSPLGEQVCLHITSHAPP